MKELMKRGGAAAILVLLILVMVFFEGTHGMSGMIYQGFTYGILMLFGAGLIVNVYEFIKETHIIVVSPKTLLSTILSVGALLIGMQGLWNTAWDLKSGPATYKIKAENISWDTKQPLFRIDNGEYAIITSGYGEQRLKLDTYAKEMISAAQKEEEVTILYWEHSKKVYEVTFDSYEEAKDYI